MSTGAHDVSIVAVDTGGTFTDVVGVVDGVLRVLKVPSTPDDPAVAVLDGIRRLRTRPRPETPGHGPAAEASAPVQAPEERYILVHGSTVATNALLERAGARVGLVTNAGFEDVIEIGRQNRPQLYALVGARLPPLVAPGDRHGIAGRLGPDGGEEAPLDADELAALPERLAGVDAVAVCLLHSYADPSHEDRVAAALEVLGLPLSISARLLPEYREYERMSTTVVNAYVAPLMNEYLGRLEAESGAERVRIMGSAGGALPVRLARRESVQTVLSGPAGGVVGALDVAARAGHPDIISFDMGGTSTDVSLCPGEPLPTREFTIAGMPVAVPVIDIHTVGAGGGSKAWIDAGGALRVGPRSAGADPGPICYGLGGTDVTVTDAHVWLGRLPPDAFLGGAGVLDRDAIEPALRDLADRIGTSPDGAAEGILAVADTAMEGALRVISVERGHDPADFTLVPFGGAAGLHAAGLAERLGVARLLVPPDPGVLSAYGMLVTPVRKDVSRSVLLPGSEADPRRLDGIFQELERQAVDAMREEGQDPAALTLQRWVDARYAGQSYELRVPADGWRGAFHAVHEQRYGFARPEAGLELVTLRVRATASALRPPAVRLDAADGPAPVRGDLELVYRGERIAAPRVDRAALRAGHALEGPAVVTEYSATLWLPPGWRLEVLGTGALRLDRS